MIERMTAKTVDLVETEHGTVRVEHNIDGICVVIPTPSELATDYKVMEGSDGLVLYVTMDVSRPHKGQEITQNGSTFEVLDVRPNGSGHDVLNGNTGVWEQWVED